ncbi:MAG: hypothetical protein ACI8P9_002987 [Parasphingorhabdus sp.]|jgi:hypothetical protein
MNAAETMPVTIRLYDIAHSHAGDKGNRCSISVIPYKPEDYDFLLSELTESRVINHFQYRNPTSVKRYRLDNLPALNFVINQVLEGGVNRSLGLDGHGQSLSFHLLTMQIVMPEHWHNLNREALGEQK